MAVKDAAVFVLTATVSLLFYDIVYGGFYPNLHGRLGMDYTYFLPRLLDGYYWYSINGLWETPWFTPSFCGGLPFFGNPQSMYHSVPQVLTIFVDPVNSVYYTILFFAFAGFCGFYLLLKDVFLVNRPLAYLGAALFMFNGFYAHRMIVGHFAFHAYQLLPLACYYLLRPLPEPGHGRKRRYVLDSAAAAWVFAIMIYSGMLELGLPVGAAVTLIGALYGIYTGKTREFWGRFVLSWIIALILGAARLSATLAFMAQFQRDYYDLPAGIASPLKVVWLIVQILYVWPEKMLMYGAHFMIGSKKLVYGVHYYEYSVTIVPLLLLIPAGWVLARDLAQGKIHGARKLSVALNIGVIVFIISLIMSLLYSFDNPMFGRVMKSIPIIKSYTNFVCWVSALVPIAILAPIVLFHRLRLAGVALWAVMAVCLTIAAAQIWAYDRNSYNDQHYNFDKIIAAYDRVKSGNTNPSIDRIVDQSAADWGHVMNGVPLGGDDGLVEKASPMICYEPIFGYSLFRYPAGRIKVGSAMDESDGFFNLKNPACYAYPSENVCRPGDHFRVDQQEMAERFRSYKPIDFQMPLRQKVANWISLAGLVTTILFLFYYINNLIFPIKGWRKHEGGESS
ncbi:MAG: hypothetical protein OEZ55_01480 [Nitrospinota bacterium]|nr:hypothetical protein [Nitrospinota bacterium]